MFPDEIGIGRFYFFTFRPFDSWTFDPSLITLRLPYSPINAQECATFIAAHWPLFDFSPFILFDVGRSFIFHSSTLRLFDPKVLPPMQLVFVRLFGGFASKENLEAAKLQGIKDVCFSKGRGLDEEDMCRSTYIYKVLRKFRAGIESGISWLKRVFGLDRCLWKGFESILGQCFMFAISALIRRSPSDPSRITAS
jgi:hypothetical protein